MQRRHRQPGAKQISRWRSKRTALPRDDFQGQGCGIQFICEQQKTRKTRRHGDALDSHSTLKLKLFVERGFIEQKQIVSNKTSEKRLTSAIYKELLQVNNTLANQSENKQMIWMSISPKMNKWIINTWKVLNVTNRQGNANIKHSEIPPHTHYYSYYQTTKNTILERMQRNWNPCTLLGKCKMAQPLCKQFDYSLKG